MVRERHTFRPSRNFTARHLLGFELIPSLFIGTALSATSVGVSVLVWDAAGRIKTELGEQLIDVAELDDISAVVFMIVLFAIAPLIHDGADATELSESAVAVIGMMVSKAAILGLLCYLFARYFERPITGFFSSVERAPDPMIAILGIGFSIAAIAGWLGFSVAIGALFAGLAFSRDPEAVRMESSFLPVYDWLTPFFFIAIGLQFEPTTAIAALGIGSVLLVVAVLGKLVGAGVPALLQSGPAGGALLGVSMIPRAEIGLVILKSGRELGEWAVPPTLFGAMVFVSACTCVGSALVLRCLFQRFPPSE